MDQKSLVIDIGSAITKIGYSGEEQPRAIIPSIIGYPRRASIVGTAQKVCYVGIEAEKKRTNLALKNIIEKGTVNNWDSLETLLESIYSNDLKISSSNLNVLFTELNKNIDSTQKFCEILFEKFKIPGISIKNPAYLSLLSYGKKSGVVVESGDCTTQTVCVNDGFIIGKSIERINFAGRNITENLVKILRDDKGIELGTNSIYYLVNKIKESYSLVALNYKEESKSSNLSKLNMNYELPDGTEIPLSLERIQCTESLFNPLIIGLEFNGIHEMTFKSIMSCDEDIRANLFQNIFLGGGNCLIKGFRDRLTTEMTKIVPQEKNYLVNVSEDNHTKYSAWTGGSILAALSSFDSCWVSNETYKEKGVDSLFN